MRQRHNAVQVQAPMRKVLREPRVVDRVREAQPGRISVREKHMHMTEPQRRERKRRKDDELIAEFPIPSRDRPLVRQDRAYLLRHVREPAVAR